MRRKKKDYNRFFLSSIGIIFILVAGSYAVLDYFTNSDFLEVDNLQVIDDMIIFGNGCEGILARTSPERAESIRLGMEGRIEQRPTTHDSFVDVLRGFNITLQSVEITRFDGNFYYSDMILSKDNKVLRLDMKPSDGIAVAVRTDSPIYINATMLDEIGQNIC